MRRQLRLVMAVGVVFALLVASLAGCSNTPAGDEETPSGELVLVTTTSTYDSGLLDVLIPMYEEQTGVTVKPIPVGTGAALAMADKGEADVALVHAPAAEIPLVDNGSLINRQLIMHNDFAIVGPADDPANIGSAQTAAEALGMIQDSESLFVSRGDDSGTNKKELALWDELGAEPSGTWYQETGDGMGATLQVASEKSGYTLTDRGTYLALRDNLDLNILFEGDPELLNIYHVAEVNPEKFDGVNAAAAKAFVDFLLDADTQKVIGEFGVDKYGQPLFFPDGDKTEEDLLGS